MGIAKSKRPQDGDGVSFAPPPLPDETDDAVLALKARLAEVSRQADRRAARERLPRKLLPLAWCFAIASWIAAIVAFAR